MTKIAKVPARDIEAEMLELYIERGSQTEKDLIGLGFTKDQISTYAPKVAERLRLSNAA
ncbi:MAG TPA: hypothetical protein VGN93_31220 [Shinella sp.]|jgi:hypothetical protein|uniref:hypothetical protein n=1 Tax=Shinella sp. TaxID=1870904 RepID=UPI002E11D20A|nr:hypothetical protein [Shinella sp.]